ncbi:cysteine proteinase [Amylocystis lapponica]|nr:cysteine proteinase [Amylocystis lapponica]
MNSEFIIADYARYRSQLELQRLRETLTPSRSVTDLRSPPTQALENRRHSFHDDFLQRALQRARKSLDGPKAPQYTPNFDDLRKDLEAIDKGIDYRIHGQPIPSSLPPEDDAFVDDLLERQGVIAKCGREQVTDRDISRLQPHQWLNDEIINFYGQMILDRSECKENPGGNADGRKKSLNVHYFSTFFWTKLKSVGYEKGRLAKWTKKIDIFSKNIVLIPVNHNNAHWTAAAINFDKKRIESHDSMGMGRQSVFDLLRKYLDAEHRNKKNKPFDFDGWSDYFNEDLPQQENGWDCGVFTCQFLESLSRGEERFTFQQDHMPYVRRRMLWEIGKVKLRDGP